MLNPDFACGFDMQLKLLAKVLADEEAATDSPTW
jgi:hypothetical protein